jgi:two-component system sensor kinase
MEDFSGDNQRFKSDSQMKRGFREIWSILTEPSQLIINPTVRFQARIVTITILVLIVMVVLSVMAQSDLSPLALLLLLAGYFLSRSKYYVFSAYLVIANISFFVIIALFDAESFTTEIVFLTIAWLTPSLILAGLLFSIREMLLVSFFHLLVPFALTLIVPEITSLTGFVGGGYILVVSAMILVSMYLRNLMEKENQKELARLNEELEIRVKERTAQLEAFSYSVSHDLRAPLRAIRGFSEILTTDFKESLDPEGQMYLGRIESSSKKMDNLIDDLLMLSRLGRTELLYEKLELGSMAEVVFQELIRTEDHREITFSTQACPQIMADKQLTKILLTNLISNAIKFTRGREPAVISFGFQRSQGRVEYCLKDNGIGFDAEHAQNVLQPFQRLHPEEEYEGTGIGLAIVDNIIRRHNGQLRIESQPGEGTAVYFIL